MSDYLDHVVSIIEEAIKRKKTSAAKASTEAVGYFSFVRNMKIGKSPRLEGVKKLCDVLGLDMYIGLPEDYQGLKKAAIIGSIKGEEVSSNHDLTKLTDADLESCEQIAAPSNAGSMIAFTIEDNNLFPPLSEGAIIFADMADKCDSSKWEQFIGDACLLMLEDGNNIVRVLRKGDNTGLFNLESLAGKPTLPNQLPILCLPIRWIRKAEH